MNAATIDNLLDDLLDSAVAELTSPPARQFVAHGAWSHDCVAEGSLVHTDRGPIPIEEVQVGDHAWSCDADGQLVSRPVTATMDKGVRDVVSLKTRRREVRATDDHRVMILRCQRRPGKKNVWTREWTAVRDVQIGDYLVVINRLPSQEEDDLWLPDGTHVTPDVAWLLGLVLADGSIVRGGRGRRPNALRICVFGEVRDRARQILHDVWGLESFDHPTAGLVTHSRSLARCLSFLGLSYSSVDRLVPPMLLSAPHKIMRALVDGYAVGDGHQHSRGWMAYAAANEPLIRQIRALHMTLGDFVTNVHVEERKKIITIKGKRVADPKPLFRFAASRTTNHDLRHTLDHRGARRALPDYDLTIEPVKRIASAGSARVYDLTVDGSHSFLADGAVVHNCECVAVSLRDWSLGPAGERADFPVVNEITLTVTVLRCYPSATGDEPVPDASDLTTSTNTLLVDLAELTEGLSSRWDAGTLFPNVPALEGTQVSWLGARPVGPEGGFAGWECSITIRS